MVMSAEGNQTNEEIKVRILETRYGKITEGRVLLRFWSKRERISRAFKFGGACWIGALLSIALPIVHFLLVPGLIVAGPVVYYFVIRRKSVIVGGEGLCPHCGAVHPISRAPHHFPLPEICANCRSSLSLEPLAPNPVTRQ